jgi:hypothetical protein
MKVMETKILGIILSILGITGLILALIYMNDAASTRQFVLLFACGVLGAIAFFAGIRLVPSENAFNKPAEARANNIAE